MNPKVCAPQSKSFLADFGGITGVEEAQVACQAALVNDYGAKSTTSSCVTSTFCSPFL